MFILSLGVTSPGISPVTWLSLLARGLGIAFVSSLGISMPLITPVILSMGAWHFCLVFLGTYPLITHLLPQLRFFLYILVTSEIYFLYLIITEFIIIITIIIIIIIIVAVVVVAIVIIITFFVWFLFREASIDYKNYY